VTTARDLSILAVRLRRDFPEEVNYSSIKKYRYPGTPAANATNRNTMLFRDPTVDGLKTGHTDAAGFCVVVTAKRDAPNLPGGRQLLSIVLGASSDHVRTDETQKLLNWGYSAYEDVPLFAASQAVATPRVWKGAANTVKIGRAEPIIVAVPAGSSAKVKTQVVEADPLIAPFTIGQPIGSLKVSIADQALTEVPLVALGAVESAGFVGRAWDAARLKMKW
jgi:D-alanyl-D-alanine carboxypeptidase (penicillin-binding protein 5/6)